MRFGFPALLFISTTRLNEQVFYLLNMLQGLEEMFRIRTRAKALTLSFDRVPIGSAEVIHEHQVPAALFAYGEQEGTSVG